MLTEGMVEYVFGNIPKLKPFLMYIALIVGVALAAVYRVDILASLGLVSPVPWVGFVISGLIIGRGSNYVNDIVSLYREFPKNEN